MKRVGKLMMLSISMAVVFLCNGRLGYWVCDDSYSNSKFNVCYRNGYSGCNSCGFLENVAMTKVLIMGIICGIVTTWNSFSYRW